ncbi:Cupredoxin [Dactylonectria estremocensis]|uniref:Cupredoxin n=1 Tax=Dactylonectria estremocensis TaxID=1079267 RepID=A0A9P9EVF1_9HYPO|nr:Cupredoxin [Dactylonectria estremocensis]
MHTTPLIALSVLASTAAAAVHIVEAGEDGLKFNPESTKAAVGDTIEFHFYPTGHSVAQSSFEEPCKPLNSTSFYSGPINVSSGQSNEVFTITVENEDPIWYYCAAVGHCEGGMVGVINGPSSGSKTIANYAKAAAKVSDGEAPSKTGGGTLGKAASATASSSGSATASGSSTGSAASATGSGSTTASGSSSGTTTGSAASATSSGSNAGLEARGDIRWGLMSVGLAMAGLVAGFMV